MNQSLIASPNCAWREEKGIIRRSVDIIRLSANADGTTGPLWIPRLKSQGCEVHQVAESILCSPEFTLSKPGTLEIAILRGILFKSDDRYTSAIRAMANDFGFTKPEMDASCILREILSNEVVRAMRLRWIVIMHEPFNLDGIATLLRVGRPADGRWLSTTNDYPTGWWPRDDGGFAFAVAPQDSPQCSVP